jgi:hypothetical protein
VEIKRRGAKKDLTGLNFNSGDDFSSEPENYRTLFFSLFLFFFFWIRREMLKLPRWLEAGFNSNHSLTDWASEASTVTEAAKAAP